MIQGDSPNALQDDAVWCRVLQFVAVCCSMLLCIYIRGCASIIAWYSPQTLQCDAACCSVMQRVAVCTSVLHRVAVCCRMLQCVAGCGSMLQSVLVPQSDRIFVCYIYMHVYVWTYIIHEWIGFNGHFRLPECVAVCCSVLRCAVQCCSVVQRSAVFYILSKCVAMCCSGSQCVAASCSVLRCVAVCCSVLQCAAACCSVLQRVAMFFSITYCSDTCIVYVNIHVCVCVQGGEDA